MKKYTFARFMQEFSTNRQCLEFIAAERWPHGITCGTCERVTGHHLIESRKCYSCQECGTQTYPTAGTIFHKSRTPLTVWFYVVFQMAKTRCGVSAKQIERETGVTYKTAWRMCQLVRAALSGEGGDEAVSLLAGVVEVDETYVGGQPRYKGQRRPGRPSWNDKQPVVGIAERGGRVRAFVVPNVKRDTVFPLIEANVIPGATVYTDEYPVYRTLPEKGYYHDVVRHKARQYAREVVDEATGEITSVHTNTIEGFWMIVKNGVRGVHRGVGRKYLARYVGEYTYRYNRRNDEEPMFLSFLQSAARSEQHAAVLPDTPPQ